jgi:GGDEF domain-containing protein
MSAADALPSPGERRFVMSQVGFVGDLAEIELDRTAGPLADCRSRQRVASMTEQEKTRALLVDELTCLGNRRAWEERDHRPFQAVLDVEGLKWVNDNVGWAAGDALLKAVAGALRAERIRAYRLGGDEFVFESDDVDTARAALDRLRQRLGTTEILARRADGSPRRLRGPRIHAGIGRSLDEAQAELNAAKRAGVATGERASRGHRPRGLSEDRAPSVSKPKPHEAQVRRFYVQALREADPDLDTKTGKNGHMSLGWLIRRSRGLP